MLLKITCKQRSKININWDKYIYPVTTHKRLQKKQTLKIKHANYDLLSHMINYVQIYITTVTHPIFQL